VSSEEGWPSSTKGKIADKGEEREQAHGSTKSNFANKEAMV